MFSNKATEDASKLVCQLLANYLTQPYSMLQLRNQGSLNLTETTVAVSNHYARDREVQLMSIAYVILVHNNFPQVVRLIDTLSEPLTSDNGAAYGAESSGDTFIVHVDTKASLEDYKHLCRYGALHPNVYILPDAYRTHCNWVRIYIYRTQLLLSFPLFFQQGAFSIGMSIDYSLPLSSKTLPHLHSKCYTVGNEIFVR